MSGLNSLCHFTCVWCIHFLLWNLIVRKKCCTLWEKGLKKVSLSQRGHIKLAYYIRACVYWNLKICSQFCWNWWIETKVWAEYLPPWESPLCWKWMHGMTLVIICSKCITAHSAHMILFTFCRGIFWWGAIRHRPNTESWRLTAQNRRTWS